MKKKTFLLITLLISIVLNIKVVNAATELTCVYQHGTLEQGFKFTQASNGDKKYYRYYNNKWYEFDPRKIKMKGKEEEYYENGNYIACPKSAHIGSFNPEYTTKVKFTSKDKWLDYRQDGELIIEKTAAQEAAEEKFENSCNYYNKDTNKKALTVYYNESEIEILNGNGAKITSADYNNKITADKFIDAYNNNNNKCPNYIYYNEGNTVSTMSTSKKCISVTRSECSGDDYYVSEAVFEGIEKVDELTDLKELESCEELIPTDSELYKLINKYMNILRLIVPILLIIFGIIDFLKAMFSDEDTMTKSKKTFLKRLAAAVIVFIIPMFINLVLGIANTVWSNINPETCVK